MNMQRIESFLTQYPIYQYRLVKTEEIPFSQKVRDICEHECERYQTSWSCPPAVGTVEECRQRAGRYEYGLVFSTVAETAHAYDFKTLLETRAEHEDVTQDLSDTLQKDGIHVLTLSTESCSLCRECTYPHGNCCFPHHMHPCIESYGIVLTALLEKLGMDYALEGQQVLWFSILFLRTSYNI